MSVLKAVCGRGLLEEYEKTVERIPTDTIPAALLLQPLSPAQQRAHDEIVAQWAKHDVCLLHGVTSSGKTEIYIHLISKALAEGKQVLYMLPEIVLTSQLTDRLRRVFGDRLGVYHSRYTDAERVEVYRKQVSDHPYDIIVGVRSSVLLPFHRLGLVIVDEEHESSFKQSEPAPRYHGRNVALMMARMAGAKTLLGTATPSVETYHNARTGKYGYVSLTTRHGNVSLEIIPVDLAELKRKKMMSGPLLTLAPRRDACYAGTWRTDNPVPEPPWLCPGDGVQRLRLGAALPPLRCGPDAASAFGTARVSLLRLFHAHALALPPVRGRPPGQQGLWHRAHRGRTLAPFPRGPRGPHGPRHHT